MHMKSDFYFIKLSQEQSAEIKDEENQFKS